MILYKIQHQRTKLFVRKKIFYWAEKSRWDQTGSCWDSIDDVAKYLVQFSKLSHYDTGVDISEWQIVEYVATQQNSIPAIQAVKTLQNK